VDALRKGQVRTEKRQLSISQEENPHQIPHVGALALDFQSSIEKNKCLCSGVHPRSQLLRRLRREDCLNKGVQGQPGLFKLPGGECSVTAVRDIDVPGKQKAKAPQGQWKNHLRST
jgi:hypothetical protein